MPHELPSSLTVGEMQAAGANMSPIRSLYERMKSGSAVAQLAKAKAVAAGHGLRAGGESLLVGGMLAAAHTQLPTGLDYKKVPIDAVAGVLALVAGAATSPEEFSKDLQNTGAAALAIFSFRKTHDFIAAKMKEKGKKPGSQIAGEIEGLSHYNGDFGEEDPIIAAARFL